MEHSTSHNITAVSYFFMTGYSNMKAAFFLEKKLQIRFSKIARDGEKYYKIVSYLCTQGSIWTISIPRNGVLEFHCPFYALHFCEQKYLPVLFIDLYWLEMLSSCLTAYLVDSSRDHLYPSYNTNKLNGIVSRISLFL